ncbi:hypothetical protein ABEB22_05200 [Thioclava sp. 'Guangxiensis']|uniref:COG4223 family protein n=1 Tax=Thioclava sp. 'Guangxiensis' TaxID=3149044 RepID=UPI003877DBDF
MAAPGKKKSAKTDAAKDESITPASGTAPNTETPATGAPKADEAVDQALPADKDDTAPVDTPVTDAPEADISAPETPEEAPTVTGTGADTVDASDETDPLEGHKESLASETAFGTDDVVDAEQKDMDQKDGSSDAKPETPIAEEKKPEPVASVAAPAPTAGPVIEKRGGFGPVLAGGVIAAVIGAAAALWVLPQLPENIQARFFPAPAAPDNSAMENQVADLSSQLSAITQSVSALQDNIASLGQAGDTSGLQSQLDALQSKLDGLTGPDADAAKEAERQARARAAIAELQAALTNGTPIADPVAMARDAQLDVPAALGTEPESVKALQEAFPAPARQALDAARRADAGDSLGAKLETFLLTQTGARSVAPKEGNTPDAILSRAQAAVDKADFKTAITEISALPQVSQDALSGWVDQAQTRVAAEEAVSSLASQVQ